MYRTRLICVALVFLGASSVVSCPRRAAEVPQRWSTAIQGLSDQLRDTELDWRKRVLAAQRLGETRHPGAVKPLGAAVRDKDRRVRLAVTQACGEHRSPKLIPVLKIAIADVDLKVRLNAVVSLTRVGTRDAAEAMVEALDGASMLLQPAVADGLSLMPSKVLHGLEAASQIFIAELNTGDEARHRRLARGLAAIGEPALKTLLRAMLVIRKSTGRSILHVDFGIQALVEMGERVVPTLLRLAREGVAKVNQDLLYACLVPSFSGMGVAAIPHVIGYLGQDTMPGVLAEKTLSKMGVAAVPSLVEQLRGRTQRTAAKKVAARLLGEVRDSRATVALITALGEPRFSVRAAAIRALACHLTLGAYGALLKLLKGGPKVHGQVIVDAARAARGVFATRLLVQALVLCTGPVAVAAAQALGARDHPQVVPALLAALKRRSRTLRVAAVRALGAVKGSRRYKVLSRLALRGDKEQRVAAVWGLRDLATPDAVSLLRRLARSRTRAVAKGAAAVLDPACLDKYGYPRLGLPHCDRYLVTLECILRRMPEVNRGPVAQRRDETIRAWTKAYGKSPAAADKVCRNGLAAWKKGARRKARYRSCLKH